MKVLDKLLLNCSNVFGRLDHASAADLIINFMMVAYCLSLSHLLSCTTA